MNKVILKGNMGRDIELRHTKSGTAVCDISVATKDRRKSGDKWEDITEWHTVTLWGKTAERANQYLAKGSEVLVEGRIQTDSYEKDGAKVYKTKVVCDRLEFCGGRPSTRAQARYEAPDDGQTYNPPDGGYDDDVPF